MIAKIARRPLFGVAGNPPNFWASEHRKNRANAIDWLHSIGLDALEIQCTYGVRMTEASAALFREKSEQFHISLSIHAPYYISLANPDSNKIENTLREFAKAVNLARTIGSTRVIFHPGAVYGDRRQSLDRAIETLMKFETENDMGDIDLYPEIAGKVKQLGSLEEILAICSEIKHAWPCLDLAHLHAREQGCLMSKIDYDNLFDTVCHRLGSLALKKLHLHMYPIEWSTAGEVTHRAFSDTIPCVPQQNLFQEPSHDAEVFYPRYESLLQSIHEKGLYPTIICEAKDSQDVGSILMKNYYHNMLQGERP